MKSLQYTIDNRKPANQKKNSALDLMAVMGSTVVLKEPLSTALTTVRRNETIQGLGSGPK